MRIDGDGEASPVRTGEALFSGQRLETHGDTRAALELVSGSTLRLDRDTRIELLGERAVSLERGALYFDSNGDALPTGALEVHTPLGVITDIGTQFEVRQGEALRVRVREGRVHLDRADNLWEATAGTELRLSAGGEVTRHPTPVFGPSWDWILDVSPSFRLEGHTLDAFLAWVSRETGWQVEFADEATAASANDVILHGSIDGLRPDRALEAVLPTCGLERSIERGILLIEAETR